MFPRIQPLSGTGTLPANQNAEKYVLYSEKSASVSWRGIQSKHDSDKAHKVMFNSTMAKYPMQKVNSNPLYCSM